MIEINASPVEKIDVKLVGKAYKVTPPKAAFAMKIAREAREGGSANAGRVVEVMDEWMERAFGKAQHTAVQKRLDDPTDDLDLPHIMQLMELLIEEQSDGNPTS
jgi:hypothetical protein